MKRLSIFLLLYFCAILLAGTSWAKGQSTADLKATRDLFLRAERALESGDHAAYERLKQKLHDYPLLPYLEYQEIRQNFHKLDQNDIRLALQRFSDTPLQYQLRRDWLNTLAKQNRWNTYLEFSTPGGTITQQCHRLNAMIRTGHKQEAYQKVEAIWLHGYSRPDACDPVLNAWIGSGLLTKDLVWRRVALAIESDQLRLARYLKRFLPSTDQKWVDRWIDLHLKPSNPNRLLQERHPYADEIVVETLKRLTRKDAKKALDIWQQIYNNPRLSDRQQLSVIRTLASHLAVQDETASLQRLRSLVPAQLRSDPKFSDKLLQVALRQNDWNQVLNIINDLTFKEKGKEQWNYWYARALGQLGRNDEAKKAFESLARERSYYGFMAADHLGLDFSFLHESLPVSQHLLDQVASLPGLVRARELFALDRALEARREWNLALQNSSTDEFKAAAKLAQEWNWPSQAILTLAKIRQWNDLELRFPLKHRQQVDRQAKSYGLESAWIYAILRQESAFNSDARSRAGAIGLMQLMPTTAKEVASKAKTRPFKLNDLFQPGVNIELGSSYLNQIYRQLQENPILATAAYNAGPSRVKKWLPDEPQATDVWIETVPFSETREYLKRVLAYTLIYNHRLGNTPERLPKRWQKPIGAADIHNEPTTKPGSPAYAVRMDCIPSTALNERCAPM